VEKQVKGNKVVTWSLIDVLAIIWGSSFILMKRGLLVFSPVEVGAYRMFLSFAVMIPFSLKYLKTIKPAHWKFICASGFLGNGIPAILFPYAQTMIASSMAGMLNSLTPVFTLLAGSLVFGIKVKKQNVAGVFLGLAGAVILILIHSKGAIGSNPAYGLYIVIATVCYAFSVNILRSRLFELEPVAITGFALMFAGVPAGLYLLTTSFYHTCTTNPEAPLALLYISILSIMGTGVSTVLFNILIKGTTALAASSVTYLIPIVAILWGVADKENIGLFHMLSMAGILGGVYLINRK
jgi:drug/metabolite transporter (DMT)-like permease